MTINCPRCGRTGIFMPSFSASAGIPTPAARTSFSASKTPLGAVTRNRRAVVMEFLDGAARGIFLHRAF